ncbi:hypothetical protein [Kitasatospora sp. NPDC101183]|uniref:hypothetical protein n=1 Tax=Kitasatospora sp. NPDC101183 TaxID=3364100 RepID=UPI0037F276A4
MPGTVITDLRRRGAVDPGRLLAGPLRGVGLRRLDPGRSAELAAEGVEHAVYVTAGSGLASLPDDALPKGVLPEGGLPDGSEVGVAIPLVEGTALVLPLGRHTVLTAGTAGLEFFQAVLAVPGHQAPPQDGPEDEPHEDEGGDPR